MPAETVMSDGCSTSGYRAPEAWWKCKVSREPTITQDSWSLAMLAYRLASGQEPSDPQSYECDITVMLRLDSQHSKSMSHLQIIYIIHIQGARCLHLTGQPVLLLCTWQLSGCAYSWFKYLLLTCLPLPPILHHHAPSRMKHGGALRLQGNVARSMEWLLPCPLTT